MAVHLSITFPFHTTFLSPGIVDISDEGIYCINFSTDDVYRSHISKERTTNYSTRLFDASSKSC
eukprot:3035829-Pyramimonas_sp.AAC.2